MFLTFNRIFFLEDMALTLDAAPRRLGWGQTSDSDPHSARRQRGWKK